MHAHGLLPATQNPRDMNTHAAKISTLLHREAFCFKVDGFFSFVTRIKTEEDEQKDRDLEETKQRCLVGSE
jgi:hypothetical protein